MSLFFWCLYLLLVGLNQSEEINSFPKILKRAERSIAEISASDGDNIFSISESSTRNDWTEFQRGLSDCPCLAPEDVSIDLISDEDRNHEFYGKVTMDFKKYGFGCATHDVSLPICTDGCPEGNTISPPPIDCDKSWCKRNWCWVDPGNCKMLNRRSNNFHSIDRFSSYATCWDMDSFTQDNRLGSLKGRYLRAGFNHNSGGWLGAYGEEYLNNPVTNGTDVLKGTHFVGPFSRWSGPAVSFVTEAARAGNFFINITEPPTFLKPHVEAYFGSSNFDFCVYATALGYLDFCVAQYTVTDKRASVTDWLLLGSQDVYLIVKMEEDLQGWNRFVQQTQTIFQPFTFYTWLFIVLIVIPILGGLMVIHEWGHAGSGFPTMESVVEVDKDGNKSEPFERKVPLYRHLMRSIYIAYLSVLQQDYSQSIVTYGAMMNLLGISFFILTIIAVYTANLAAILSQKPDIATISSLDEALKLGMRVCAERYNLNIVRSLNQHLPDSLFVEDPVYLGGDGLPGFACSNCASRTRVFNMIRSPSEVAKNSSYCNVAIAPLEDLQVEQKLGNFCKLAPSTAGIVGQVQTGLPIYEGVSEVLISLFLKLKNDGVYDKEVITGRPDSQCPIEFRGEGSPLSISQLTGIWVVSFGFAVAGLIVTFVSPLINRNKETRIQPIIEYDQSGNRINILEDDDEEFVNNKTTLSDTGRVFVSSNKGQDSGLDTYMIDLKDGDGNTDSFRFGEDGSSSRSKNSKRSQPQESRPKDDDSFTSQDGRNFRYL